MKCDACGSISDPKNEKHWRLITVTINAVPPRVAPTKLLRETLCPLCANEADMQLTPALLPEQGGDTNVQ